MGELAVQPGGGQRFGHQLMVAQVVLQVQNAQGWFQDGVFHKPGSGSGAGMGGSSFKIAQKAPICSTASLN